jgi:hypothetical protein
MSCWPTQRSPVLQLNPLRSQGKDQHRSQYYLSSTGSRRVTNTAAQNACLAAGFQTDMSCRLTCAITRPFTRARGTGPYSRESRDRIRLSPCSHTCPGGTCTAQQHSMTMILAMPWFVTTCTAQHSTTQAHSTAQLRADPTCISTGAMLPGLYTLTAWPPHNTWRSTAQHIVQHSSQHV